MVMAYSSKHRLGTYIPLPPPLGGPHFSSKICYIFVKWKLYASVIIFRCGLSALSMAAELLQKQDNDGAICSMEETQELDNLLKMAQARGFSYQGEMYSAENLAKLAKEFYGYEYLVTRTAFEDTSDNFVISEVLKGNAVLIPYDADKNHEPCLENGHRAHWALITGQFKKWFKVTLSFLRVCTL